VRRVSKKSNNDPKAIREWKVVLIRSRGQLLGWVKGANREAAEIRAAETFRLNEWQRRRLLLREQV
jgi:hypothetical protein